MEKFDYPLLSPPSGGTVPVGLQIPVRLIYPINEQTLNKETAMQQLPRSVVTLQLRSFGGM